jgi:predicted unusual protein kinase regulating ubiquinone biosynthesis (AarF/ABC1/UbiB family)
VDFGIVGILDRRTTDALRAFAQSLFAGEVEEAVEEFWCFVVPSRRTDLAAARRELVDALRDYLDSSRTGPGGRAPGCVFEIEMLSVVRRHGMSLAPDAVRYLKAVLTAEAVVRELDPSFDLRAHENRFFARLMSLEAAELFRPRALGSLLFDLRTRLARALEGLEGLREAPARLGMVAADVRHRVQLVAAIAILGWLALIALWVLGTPRMVAWLGSPLGATVLLGGLPTFAVLALAIRQVRRLPRHGQPRPVRSPRR